MREGFLVSVKNQSGSDDSWMTHSVKDAVQNTTKGINPSEKNRKEQQKVNTHTQFFF